VNVPQILLRGLVKLQGARGHDAAALVAGQGRQFVALRLLAGEVSLHKCEG
jgi:hypothetical protein